MPTTAQRLKSSIFLSYDQFCDNFSYRDDYLYALIFERNKEYIKISKEKFAIRNLQKILDATFRLSPKIGFQAMSLRDLSAATGLSMGGLYSSISSKEVIAIIVKDVVSVICAEIVDKSRKQGNPKLALEVLIRGYLYASTMMQPWFYFLYFETKSLPQADQEESKNIERAQVWELERLLKQLSPETGNRQQSDFVATMALSLTQERYLKPWKYQLPAETVDVYADHCLQLIYRAIGLDESGDNKNG